MNRIESIVSELNPQIAYIIRGTRLSLASDDALSKIFVEFVLPFALLVCLKINNICEQEKIKNIIFLSRDGYWFHEIYKIIFPSQNVKYFYFSRLHVQNNGEFIRQQFENIKGRKFVFDLQGSGRTFHSLNVSDCHYFMCFLSHNSNLKNYMYRHSNKISIIKTVIEDLFIAPHGSIHSYNDGIYNILDPEYDTDLIKSYFEGVGLFQKYWNTMKKYYSLSINANKLDSVAEIFFDDIKYQTDIKSSIHSLIKHVNVHDEKYTKYPLSFYSQIGQDKYFIENIIKYRQGGTFIEIGGYDGITGSNTYFLEKNLDWNGIIVECNPKLVDMCRKNRTCMICDKALYYEDNEILDFTIPLGSDIPGGKEQLGGITQLLKLESLKAFEKCYKTSTSIKVKTISINTLLQSNKIYDIDYVSLDVEGGEISILKSWDFNKFRVKYITVEHGNVSSNQREINNILSNNGFYLYRNNKWDDEYIHKTFLI